MSLVDFFFIIGPSPGRCASSSAVGETIGDSDGLFIDSVSGLDGISVAIGGMLFDLADSVRAVVGLSGSGVAVFEEIAGKYSGDLIAFCLSEMSCIERSLPREEGRTSFGGRGLVAGVENFSVGVSRALLKPELFGAPR